MFSTPTPIVIDHVDDDTLHISLAAYSLQQIGLLNATDIIGGYQAWKDIGLSVGWVTPSDHGESQ